MKLKKFNFKIVNSTNNVAIRIIRHTNSESGIVIAEKQNKGRGQYGNKWTSYKGNLFVSIFFRIDKINLTLGQMTKINCLLVKKLLSIYYKQKITIKKKKISGILQEKINDSKKTFIIIGIGINLIKSPNLSHYPTTSLFELTNNRVDRNIIILKLKKLYEKFIPKFYRFNKLSIEKI